MEDKTLLILAISSASVGVIALCILMFTNHIPEKTADNITAADIGKKVAITGVIERVRTTNKMTIVTIAHQCAIDAVVFDKINISAGSSVRVEGVVQEYRGKRELITDSMTINSTARKK
ncbi:MAG: hypothetical protein WC916_02170 [Candidatus Woesearchaeota archaeon]